MKCLPLILASGITVLAAANEAVLCRHCAAPPSESEPRGERHYAPDRKADIRHLLLDVTPDFENRTVRGAATIHFQPIATPLVELRLDAIDLTVNEITSSAKIRAHQNTGTEIVITFDEPIPVARDSRVTVRYSAQPRQGLYFRVPSNGYPREDMHIWTQGESTEARHWFPCFDHPNAKFTTEVVCRVPEGLTVLSNGRMVSSEKDGDGLLAVRWKQEKPHVNYLVTLVAGRMTTLEDSHGSLPLRFYTPPSDAKQAALTFAETKPVMEFLEKEIGVPFPWAQYGQVVVRDFHWGGMENTTLTTLTERTLHTAETENIHTSEGLVAHELAHQWFGDLVTCKDWSHTWLNEGFATYYTTLFAGHRHGVEQLRYEMHRSAQSITNDGAMQKPVVFRSFSAPKEQFDNRAYGKGAWVLHMLRSELGEDLFRRCVRTYIELHEYDNVVTEDLRKVIETLSGRSFDAFFDQWLYHAGQPELDVAWSWDEKTRLAKVSVRQTQKTGADVLVFRFPLALRFRMRDGATVNHRVDVKSREEDFYLPLPAQPEIVRVDPDVTLLAKIRFTPATAMLHAQLADKSDAVGRVIAAAQLGEKKDHETVAKLRDTLNSDAFHGVRIEAAASLRKIHSEAALDALIASVKQPDARVRNAVIGDIAGFFHPRACDALLAILPGERNPAIQSTALRGLAAYHRQDVSDVLLRHLQTPSFRNQLATAAIGAMRAQDDTAYLAPLRAAVEAGESSFPSRDFSQALGALAWLARNEKSRDSVRDFLAGYVNHRREAIQLGAMQALGTLEDPKSIALLETFTAMPKDTPQRQEAEKAIASLRAVNKPADNLKDLRGEVLDLKKANEELRRQFEDFKKRTEATPAKEPATEPAKKSDAPAEKPDAKARKPAAKPAD